MKLISVCIPTYEMNGLGADFLRQSFDILAAQSFKDFDVIISDHSTDDAIKNLCAEYNSNKNTPGENKLAITYVRNEMHRGSSSANLNNAIRHANGQLIKILFQDDFLYSNDSLKEIADAFDLENDTWLVSACEHSKDGKTFYKPFFPKYNRKMHLGENTISSPSVLTIINKQPLMFDEKLIWLMDVDYYKRLHDIFGKPKILNKINVVNRVGEHQISNSQVSEERKKEEEKYAREKFGTGIFGSSFFVPKYKENITLDTVSLVVVSTIKMDETLAALTYSMDGIDYKEVILISDKKPENLDPRITFKQCGPIKNIDEYSKFMLYELDRYIDTAFALVIQYDGFVLRPRQWDKRFLDYDYVGAPWEKDAHFTGDGRNVRVGNGGFSLRSKKLLGAMNALNLPFTDKGTGFYNEDGAISNYYRKELEDYGIQYAPIPVASAFSCEQVCEDSHPKPFGFHKNKKLIPTSFFLKHLFK